MDATGSLHVQIGPQGIPLGPRAEWSGFSLGPVRARLAVQSDRQAVTTHNVVGELPGADDEVVIIGSHHDGPWSSAVEDVGAIENAGAVNVLYGGVGRRGSWGRLTATGNQIWHQDVSGVEGVAEAGAQY